MYTHTLRGETYRFASLKALMAKATPVRSGDQLAGIAAETLTEMSAAQYALAELPLKTFLSEFVIEPENDNVTRLILDQHDLGAFVNISSLTVGELRNFLLSRHCDAEVLRSLQYALTPEMVAAVSKIMRNQDLIAVSHKCEVVTKFRNTIGQKGVFASRLQPNHPADDIAGISASIYEGLIYGCGDAVIGINPASDDLGRLGKMLQWLNEIRERLDAPIQTCVLTHLSNTLLLAERGAPVDLFFQSIGGSEQLNDSFGVSLNMLHEAYACGQELNRGTVGSNFMYFETGQGSGLSANAHHGVDQQTLEARAYALAREFKPLLVNTVVGFIGPEYLFDGKQIIRAGLEDHFCGKLLGLPMGVDVCYTNHGYADQNDMDNLLSLLALAGCNFVIAVPGTDDVMLGYQTSSYHDVMYIRHLTGLRAAPEFEVWLTKHNILCDNTILPLANQQQLTFQQALWYE